MCSCFFSPNVRSVFRLCCAETLKIHWSKIQREVWLRFSTYLHSPLLCAVLLMFSGTGVETRRFERRKFKGDSVETWATPWQSLPSGVPGRRPVQVASGGLDAQGSVFEGIQGCRLPPTSKISNTFNTHPRHPKSKFGHVGSCWIMFDIGIPLVRIPAMTHGSPKYTSPKCLKVH